MGEGPGETRPWPSKEDKLFEFDVKLRKRTKWSQWDVPPASGKSNVNPIWRKAEASQSPQGSSKDEITITKNHQIHRKKVTRISNTEILRALQTQELSNTVP